jgi:inositol transport system substrate-binding protein
VAPARRQRSVISCHPVQAAERHLTILATTPDRAFPWFAHLADQIKDEANKIGDIHLVIADGKRSSLKQTANIEAAITEGVGGMLVYRYDVDARAAIQGAVNAKIPVVTVDRRVDDWPTVDSHDRRKACPIAYYQNSASIAGKWWKLGRNRVEYCR